MLDFYKKEEGGDGKMKKIIIYILVLVFIPLLALGGEFGSFGEASLNFVDYSFLLKLKGGIYYQDLIKYYISVSEEGYLGVMKENTGRAVVGIRWDLLNVEVGGEYIINFKEKPKCYPTVKLGIIW